MAFDLSPGAEAGFENLKRISFYSGTLKAENAIEFKVIVSILLSLGIKLHLQRMLTSQMSLKLPW